MKKTIFLISLSIFIFPVNSAFSSERTGTIWNSQLVVQDHVPLKQGRTTGIMGFHLNKGEFSLEVDLSTKKVVSFSGVFRNLNEDYYNLVERYLSQLKTQNGVKGIQIQKVVYDKNGNQDFVLDLDLNRISNELPPDYFWGLMNSKTLDIKLQLKKLDDNSVGVGVCLEFEDQNQKRQISL